MLAMSSRRPAQFDFPSRKAVEKTIHSMDGRLAPPQPPTATDPGPAGDPPSAWWDAVLNDRRARSRPAVPIQDQRLIDIQPEVLRIERLRCFRIVEIQRLDAIRLYGPAAIWGQVGQVLLETGCPHRTGSRDEDGCWAAR
jgi:hypothetical protein